MRLLALVLLLAACGVEHRPRSPTPAPRPIERGSDDGGHEPAPGPQPPPGVDPECAWCEDGRPTPCGFVVIDDDGMTCWRDHFGSEVRPCVPWDAC